MNQKNQSRSRFQSEGNAETRSKIQTLDQSRDPMKTSSKTNASKKTSFCSVRMHLYQTSNSKNITSKTLASILYVRQILGSKFLAKKTTQYERFLLHHQTIANKNSIFKTYQNTNHHFKKKQDGNHEPECSHVILRWTGHNHITLHLSTFFVCAAIPTLLFNTCL